MYELKIDGRPVLSDQKLDAMTVVFPQATVGRVMLLAQNSSWRSVLLDEKIVGRKMMFGLKTAE